MIRSGGRRAAGPDAKESSRDDRKLLSSNGILERVGPEVSHCQGDGETDEFQRRPNDSGEASDRDRYDPTPSGSADGGGGTRVNGVGRPDETLRAVTTIRMIRSYGKNVAANPNETRFGADRTAPLQGADSGQPFRSEQRRVPSDDMYPTDRSSRESDRHGRDPEVDVDPMLRQTFVFPIILFLNFTVRY